MAADAAEVERYATAGLTWWLEALDPWRFGGDGTSPWPLDAMWERVVAGPARRG